MERKSLTLELKAEEEGSFKAVFATFDAIDHDGDVTKPGAFSEGAEVIIGAFGHDTRRLPVGKGVIRQTEREAIVEGRFFLDTESGQQTYQTVKNLGSLQEWSYIFSVEKQSFGQFQDRPVRFLESLKVYSVDPVLAGAGINTRTTDIKSNDPRTLTELGEALLADAKAYAERVKSRAEFRAKEGRVLSTANVERLTSIADALETSAQELKALLDEASPKSDELVREFMRSQRILARLGVA